MLKNKILLLSAMIVMMSTAVTAEELSEVTHPKSPAYRLGISIFPEKQFVQAQQEHVKPEKKYAKLDNSQESNIADRTYADLSIKNLSKEIAQDLAFDEQDMIADLSLLWQGAAQQSDTINFALYKLANPDADKPNEKSVKNVLKTIASMSTIVGASMGNPVLAGSSLLGGNLFGIMSQDTKALNYKYTRVTDADMIILIRKIEDLQQNAVNLYYDYISSKKQLDMINDLVSDRQRKFELAQKNNAQRELVVITDAYYRTALDKQRTAKSEFFAKRAALEQFVGAETFLQFESEYIARENGESVKKASPSVENTENSEQSENQEYNETIKNVEEFTNNLQNQTKLEEKTINSLESQNDIPRLNNFEFPDIDGPTGLAAEIQDIFGFQKELNFKNEQKALKKAQKDQERIAKQKAKQEAKQKKIQEKELKKLSKNNSRASEKIKGQEEIKEEFAQNVKNKSEKQIAKQLKKEERAKLKSEKNLAKQAKQEAKKLSNAKKATKKTAEEQQERVLELKKDVSTSVVEKKTRAQIREEKREAKRIAKEKEIQAQEARKKKGPLKGLIFLHGQDKSVYKDYHYFTENPPVEQQVATKSKKGKKEQTKQTEQMELTNSQEISTQAQSEIKPIQAVAPVRKPTPSELMGLPPLDEIRAPELTRGGYSIHSQY